MDLSNLRVCMYLRKSREDRDSPTDEPIEITLQRHEKTLLAYSKENHISISDIKKEVVSGESLSKRPKMLEMLEEIEDGLYNAILVMDIDRLTRGGMLDQGIILNTLKDNNVKIITLDKIYDLNDDLDEDMVDFSAFFARKELKMIKKRLNRGRMKSVEEGSYIGGCPPYGYNYNKLTQQLEVNDSEAEIVRTIFDLYVNQDLGDMKIATMMRNLNIKTKHNKTWDKTTVRKIITNPIYIGKTRWGKTSIKLPLKEYDGKHEPLISEDIYYKAQELTKNRYIPRVKDSYVERNPLSGLIKCTCGRTMSLRTSKKQPDSLRCPVNCGNKGSYLNPIENRLISELYYQLKEIYSELLYKKQPKNKKNKYEALIKSNKTELNKAIEQRNKLFDLLEQGIYDNNTFLDRMNLLSEKISLLNKSIDDMEAEQDNLNSLVLKIDRIPQIESFIDFIENIYWKSNAKDKNAFLHEVVKYVNYKKTERGTDLFKLEVVLKL
jgi:DNA invertase Pin-like site-specific DNA recombinase